MKRYDVYLEIGVKRVFAYAVDWPGWCRSGTDEATALDALLEYGPRYAKAVRAARLGFSTPRKTGQLNMVERLEGNATTDFGAPGIIPSADRAKATPKDYARFGKVIRASWRALDAAATRAKGKTLRKGPRGGGRSLEKIIRHVIEADAGYLSAFGWKVRAGGTPAERLEATRRAVVEALDASARGDIAPTGPRGGKRWPARYYVRRSVWHTLAHAWEIERRSSPSR